MSMLGGKREDWFSAEAEVRYVVIDEGKILNSKIASRDVRFSKADIVTIATDGKVSAKVASLGKTVEGGHIHLVADVMKIDFNMGVMGWTIELRSPTTKDEKVTGASDVRSVPSAASGSDIIQSNVVLARLL